MLDYEKTVYNSGWVQIAQTSGTVSGTDPATGESARVYFKVFCRRRLIQNLKSGVAYFIAEARITKTNEGVRKLQRGAYFLVDLISLQIGSNDRVYKSDVSFPLDTDAQSVDKTLGEWTVITPSAATSVDFVLRFNPRSKSLYGYLFEQVLRNTVTIPAWSNAAPSAAVTSVSANRYGLQASAVFGYGHSIYSTEARFTLGGLSGAQVEARRSAASSVTADSVTYLLTGNAGNHQVTLGLNGSGTDAALDSGGAYLWTLEVEAQNGKKQLLNGTLLVPQKVTGLSANENLNVRFNGTAALVYSVIPANAEEQTVSAVSADTQIATVSNGIVAGRRPGITAITLTTADGGYTATINVAVIDAEFMPILPDEITRCSAALLNDLQQAANYLNQDLSLGLTLPAVSAERNVDPRLLKELIEAVLANVAAVIDAAIDAGKAPADISAGDVATISTPLPKRNDGTLANALSLSVYDLTLINEFNN